MPDGDANNGNGGNNGGGSGGTGAGSRRDDRQRRRPKTSRNMPLDHRTVILEFSRNPTLMANEIIRLRGEVEDAGVPEGHVVVPVADRDALVSYRALGKVDDLKKAVERLPQLETQVAQRTALDERIAGFEESAPVFGWDPAAARKAAAKLADIGKLEMREDEFEEEKGGKKEKVKKRVAFVLSGEGATAKAERLDQVIARDHDLILPALTAKADSSTSRSSAASAARREEMPPAPRETGTRDTPSPDAQRIARQRAAASF